MVQVLVLDNNQLTSLPTDIGQLSRLEKLSVKENALVTVPVSIKQLQKLSVLDLSANSLSELTAAVAECSQLEELNVSNNDLQVGCVTTAAATTGCPQTMQVMHVVETSILDVILIQVIDGEEICNVDVILHGNNDIPLIGSSCYWVCVGNPIKLTAVTESQDIELQPKQDHKCAFWYPHWMPSSAYFALALQPNLSTGIA